MRKMIGKTVVAGALAGALATGAAMAAPTCTTINDLGVSGAGQISVSDITAGYCVQAHDKVYGNFDLSGLPSNTVLTFNLNSIGANDYYQIAFGGSYGNNGGLGKNYDWSYEVAVTGAPPGTSIVELAADFNQTAGGPSILSETLTPAGTLPIYETKTGAIVAAGSTTQTVFSPGITDLMIGMHLFNKGTTASVTNTVVQYVPSRQNVPEPLTLSLFGAGLAGLGFARRKRRD